MAEPLLSVQGLSLSLPHEEAMRRILDQVSFDLYPNEVLGLVGESGSGKTMISLAIIGLLPSSAQELSFSTGSGGARISVSSFSGTVHIRQE